jgi:hypothetical protein
MTTSFIDAAGKGQTVSPTTPLPVDLEDATIAGLAIPEHDNIQLSYTGDNLTGVAYRVGSATVATLTLAYTGNKLTSITKS